MTTLLVTGGAGFIGANFVHIALASGVRRVVNLDKLTYAGNLDNLASLEGDDRHVFVRGDIADRALVQKLLGEHRPDAVVNFAAETHVDRSIDGPRAFVETNVLGTLELLEAARAHHKTLAPDAASRFRFLHVSTDEVFGSLGPEGHFREDSPYAPNSPYAASKASADHFVRAYAETFKLPTLVTNCSNNYGPYQFPEKLIPLVLLNALEGKPLPVYGDGLNVRDWLFVEDHCHAILRVLEAAKPGATYTVGGHNERTNIAIVRTLCRVLDELHPVTENPAIAGDAEKRLAVRSYADLITFVADRPGHDRRYAVDASLIARELGWTPRHTFEQGIPKTVRWYLDNRAWSAKLTGGGDARRRLGLALSGGAAGSATAPALVTRTVEGGAP